jgi:hypothetical protein
MGDSEEQEGLPAITLTKKCKVKKGASTHSDSELLPRMVDNMITAAGTTTAVGAAPVTCQQLA